MNAQFCFFWWGRQLVQHPRAGGVIHIPKSHPGRRKRGNHVKESLRIEQGKLFLWQNIGRTQIPAWSSSKNDAKRSQLWAPGLSFRAGTMDLHPRKQMHSTCPETNKWRYSFLPQPGILILLINKAEGGKKEKKKEKVSECFLCFL